MRLLKFQDGNLSLTRFDKDPPKFAILSHTWGASEDEVQFEDLNQDETKNNAKKKKGYEKIKFCAKQAASHNLEFFWVDTCCINKADVQEFQSAINLMFRWYQNAEICFVYMVDVATDSADQSCQEQPWKEGFRQSRWFTRSWTLQELLSPQAMEFYSREHQLLGNKESLEGELHTITGIPISVIRGAELSQFSTEQRISWANGRESTFEEDQAYSLVGLCGVAMAPNYGEGVKAAFERLRRRCGKQLSRENPAITGEFVARSNGNHASRSHQLPSLGIGIAELAAMFNSCLDGMKRIDAESDYSTDLRAIVAQCNADIQIFEEWGKAVGLDSQRFGPDHHEKLDDAETLLGVWEIFATIQDIVDDLNEGSSDQQHGSEAVSSRNQSYNSRHLRLEKFQGVASHRIKMEWTTRQKAGFLALSQQFGCLVGSLRALVPSETSRFLDLMADQERHGYFLSDNDTMLKPARGMTDNLRPFEFKQVFREFQKQLERKLSRPCSFASS